MLAPLDVSLYLNNALRAKHVAAELDTGTPLPDVVRDMPDTITGRFVTLDQATTAEIAAAWKQTMILNATQVLYTFTFDAKTATFAARKR